MKQRVSRWETGLLVDAGYQATTFNPETRQRETHQGEWVIETRELVPDTDKPVQGSDVAMLETLLWQLGLSPQVGSPGALGARIGSNRAGQRGGEITTLGCAGQRADDRRVFYPGNGRDCAPGSVSLEHMLARFQARNLQSFDGEDHLPYAVSQAEIATFSGALKKGGTTLEPLRRDWTLYMDTYHQYPRGVIQRQDGEFNHWLSEAVNLWETGVGTLIPATYTAQIHKAVLAAANVPAGSVARSDLLREWIGEESAHHWGSNRTRVLSQGGRGPYQATPHRMTEGTDEHGSLSFSQLVYPLRFGPTACLAHREADLNPYHPGDQVKLFVSHTAAKATGTNSCPGGLYRAFVKNDLGRAYEVTPVEGGDDVSDLRGIVGAGTPLGRREDAYEKLAKAVAYYNSGR